MMYRSLSLTYALLEGLTKAEPDVKNLITARNWLDYAVSHVPELEREKFRKRDVGVVGKRSSKEPERQSPRVFYRQETEIRPLFVASPK